MQEILFYEIQSSSIEDVLPLFLERCLERNWRVTIRIGSTQQRDSLDRHLWTYQEESFLPHGLEGEKDCSLYPIVLTTDTTNYNNAQVCFLLDGASLLDIRSYMRIIFIFDKFDPLQKNKAREHWNYFKKEEYKKSFWQQAQGKEWQKIV